MIVTFYSYKGGVGRSMALANIGDLLARSGLRVCMVDFDLEAPGLEHFFPVPWEQVQEQEGLLDLLLAYKRSMSVAAQDEEFELAEQLGRFTATIYPKRLDGGRLDLLPAGQRHTDAQISRYGRELRRFDWTDFYFNWSGELFFEWLRKTLTDRYDVILVDSRTGVTEMGGICAYQLADVMVVLCAPNLQNIEGTAAMVRHFRSPTVRGVRGERPLETLVVPARVDQEESGLRQAFRERFETRFASFQPAALVAADHDFWGLQIPYDPEFAFEEQVVPEQTARRHGELANAYQRIVDALTRLAPDDSALAALREDVGTVRSAPVIPQYDPTTRHSGPDVFICSPPDARSELTGVSQIITRAGLTVGTSGAGARSAADELKNARMALVLVSARTWSSSAQLAEIDRLVADRSRPVLPLMIHGADPGRLGPLKDLVHLDWRDGIDESLLLRTVVGMITARSAPSLPTTTPERRPYPGPVPFTEQTADEFFGRERETEDILATLRPGGVTAVFGPPGVGKTSVVLAGVVPALRAGRLFGSEQWPVVSVPLNETPFVSLVIALNGLLSERLPLPPVTAELASALNTQFEAVVAVIDQVEKLYTTTGETERRRFLHGLGALTAGTSIIVIAVARSDVEEKVTHDFAFGRRVEHVRIGALDDEGLRQAIVEPARLAGLTFEAGLVDKIVDDFHSVSSPAVLQQTLTELWQRRSDGYLTHQAYAETGGLGGILGDRAEQMFAKLTPPQQEATRLILLQLVAPFEPAGTRRRIPVHDLVHVSEMAGGFPRDALKAIDALANSNLANRIIESDVDVLELAYTRLTTSWPRLDAWMADSQEDLAARADIAYDTARWLAADRDPGLLSTAGPSELHKVPLAWLTAEEREFVLASFRETRKRRISTGISTLGSFGLIIPLLLYATKAITPSNPVVAIIALVSTILMLSDDNLAGLLSRLLLRPPSSFDRIPGLLLRRRHR